MASLQVAMEVVDSLAGEAPPQLAAEVHERLGKAHQQSRDIWDFDEVHERRAAGHYQQSLLLSTSAEQVQRLQAHMSRLRDGDAPAKIRAKRLRRGNVPAPKDDSEIEFAALPAEKRIRAYLDQLQPDMAERTAMDALIVAEEDEQPPRLNLLAEVRRNQMCYDRAWELHSLALRLALERSGVAGADATDAIHGLKLCQAAFVTAGRIDDAVTIQREALATLDAAGVSVGNTNRANFLRDLDIYSHIETSGKPIMMHCFASNDDQVPSPIAHLLSQRLTHESVPI